jgi:hypothetical protein
MIKARGERNGKSVLVLGLSHGNIATLLSGEPISFDATPYGFPGGILIFAGKDEMEMARLLREVQPNVPTFEDPNPT